jgi:translation initiation factor IF-2
MDEPVRITEGKTRINRRETGGRLPAAPSPKEALLRSAPGSPSSATAASGGLLPSGWTNGPLRRPGGPSRGPNRSGAGLHGAPGGRPHGSGRGLRSPARRTNGAGVRHPGRGPPSGAGAPPPHRGPRRSGPARPRPDGPGPAGSGPNRSRPHRPAPPTLLPQSGGGPSGLGPVSSRRPSGGGGRGGPAGGRPPLQGRPLRVPLHPAIGIGPRWGDQGSGLTSPLPLAGRAPGSGEGNGFPGSAAAIRGALHPGSGHSTGIGGGIRHPAPLSPAGGGRAPGHSSPVPVPLHAGP